MASISGNNEVGNEPNEECGDQKIDDRESGASSNVHHEEVVAAEKVLNAMLYYRRYGIHKIHRGITTFQRLSESHRKALSPAYQHHLVKVKECVIHNQRILKKILDSGISMFSDDFSLHTAAQITQLRPSDEDYMMKVKSTFKQIVRDWSIEGEAERKTCYANVLSILVNRFPDREKRSNIEILVPGAGLARLAWELVTEGFTVQGNEFSILMLLTSNFILNDCKEVNSYKIYPYVLDSCNNWSYEDQLRPICFPDVCPMSSQERLNKFSMCAGDFLQSMKSDVQRWDVLATVFFIDTAVNILDYIDAIHRLLKKNGVWINFGPLTYHFADDETESAIELPYEKIIEYIEQKGFRFVRDERADKDNLALYSYNNRSMLRYQYVCGFFECEKL